MTDLNLHPVGYCEWKKLHLSPPQGNQGHDTNNPHVKHDTGYPNEFDWMKYLVEEKMQAVAYEMFTDVSEVNDQDLFIMNK
jgi:hypothetical protein